MSIQRTLQGTLLVCLLAATATPAVAQSPANEPVVEVPTGPQVWLNGAFGRVAAGTPDAPAAAPPNEVPLDTFVRRAQLTLEADVPFEDLLSVDVVATELVSGSADDPAAHEALSTGATVFDGPDRAGTYVIEATLETDPFGTTRHAWLVAVPDREGGPEAMLDVTAPQVELIADAGTVLAVPGDGCYLFLCADMGESPPPDSLDPLRVGVGETLFVRTTDGSGLAGWNGRLTPLAGTAIDSIEDQGALTDTVESMVPLLGLEAPSRGQWILEVRVVFDRERGHQWQVFRLDAR